MREHAASWLLVRITAAFVMLAGGHLAGAADLPVASGNGLEVAMSPDGAVSRVAVDGRRVDGERKGGFFAGLGATGEPARGTAAAVGGGIHVQLAWPALGLTGEAVLTGEARCIRVRGEIADASGHDRAVTVSFGLPFGAGSSTTWWDDIDRRRPATGSGILENVIPTPAGATGTHSPYPLACVSASSGVAMGIPLDRPVLHRFSYSPPTGRLAVSFDFALTPAATRTPSKAALDFVIFPVDPVWGFRSALERCYAIYPTAFERRVPKIGGWVDWGDVKAIPDFSDYGFQYHRAPGSPAARAFDHANGLYAFYYSDYARFFSDLGTFSRRPDPKEVRQVFDRLFESGDPSAVVLSQPASAPGRIRFEILQRELGPEKAGEWLRRAVAAVRLSATADADGEYNVGYLLSRKDWGPEHWWTGRLFCDVDPAVRGGYGEFLLNDLFGRVFPAARSAGASYDGVALDNYFVDADTLDFRPEHLAASEIPLTFSHQGSRPVVLGAFETFQWVGELSRRLGPAGGWVMANLVGAKYPFDASVIDVPGYELGITEVAPLARALAYRKPVVTVPVGYQKGAEMWRFKEQDYGEAFLRQHVRFGFIPGGYADGGSFATDTTLRALYKRYVPALIRCAEAGWEPVTFGVSDNAAIKVERFGRPGGAILLSITNSTASPQAGRLRLDSKGLAVPERALTTPDLLGGGSVTWTPQGGGLSATLRLASNAAFIVGIAK